MKSFEIGSCVEVPDGRIGRIRAKIGAEYKVRLRRFSSVTHQFIFFKASELKPVACPKGWMSQSGYNRYLQKTAAKRQERFRLGQKF